MARVTGGPTKAIRATRAEIDLGALRHNAALLRRAAGGTAMAAVVKADAYGHGAVEVARALADQCAAFCVSLVEEGSELRDAGIALPILVMGPSLAGGHQELVYRDLTAVVSDAADLQELAAIGRARGRPVAVHIKVDTGMGRLGIAPHELGPLLARTLAAGGLAVGGICTHFACADLPDLADARALTHAQLAVFDRVLASAQAAGATNLCRHAANSAGLIRFPEARFDLVRPGLALYGNGLAPEGEALRPVMQLTTRIAQVRAVPSGQAVSYGGLWRAPRASRLAVLPIGYADGYPRRLTGGAEVLVRGRRCPVVGAISMDMTLVDVTSLGHDAGVGDAVVLLGAQGEERVTARELAERAGITEYEVTCGVSKRVPRAYR
jgi:alanine racemase